MSVKKKMKISSPANPKDRTFALVANDEPCRILFLSYTNFSLAEKYYHMEKVRMCEKILKHVPIMKDWNMVRRMGFAENLDK